jgi:hypothetical protein
MMPLYTFIADYDGGTYISQVTSPDPRTAIFTWAQNFDVEAIPGLGARSKQILLESLREDDEDKMLYVALDGLTSAWCYSIIVRGKLMLINFVETNQST